MDILIADGSYLCHAAMHSKTGQLTNGVLFGALRMLLSEAKDADHVTVCFDVGGIDSLLRKKLGTAASARYKENRRRVKLVIADDEDEFGGSQDEKDAVEKENDFHRQRSMFKAMCAELGFECQWAHGYEADDVIAVNVMAHRKVGNSMRLLANDSDLYQLFSMEGSGTDEDDLVFARPTDKKGDFHNCDFKAKYLCRSNVWPLVKAIAGDSTDNVLGVAGIGVKSAVKVVRGTAGYGVDCKVDNERELIRENLALVTLPFGEDGACEAAIETTGCGQLDKVALEKFIEAMAMPSLRKVL